MLTTLVKNLESERLINVNVRTQENQVEAIKLDINTIDEALNKCSETVYSTLGSLMFAVIAEDRKAVQEALSEIHFNEEVMKVLQGYRTGLTASINSIEPVGSQN